jgi:hypothetical protein
LIRPEISTPRQPNRCGNFETSAKPVKQTIGAPSIARQIVEKAASSSRAMLGVPVLQKFHFSNVNFAACHFFISTADFQEREQI